MVKGKINNELIGLYYDCSKSLKENLSTFKALNLKVGKSKLYEWCKENNIPTNIKIINQLKILLAYICITLFRQ